MIDKAMMKALEADGEKLRQLTGEDHGPYSPPGPPRSLGEALPAEMARVRDKVLPAYDAIPTGVFAATMMRQDLDRAAQALASGDVVAMMRVYEALKEYSL